jgi:hypothetical protein
MRLQIYWSECYTNCELQNSRHVRVGREHKVRRTYGVVHTAPLRVVKDIERFDPKLHADFLRGLEDLVDRHVEIGAIRRDQTVSSRVAESQALGLLIRTGIVKLRTRRARIRNRAGGGVGIANDVGIGAVSRNTIGDTGVIVLMFPPQRQLMAKSARYGVRTQTLKLNLRNQA